MNDTETVTMTKGEYDSLISCAIDAFTSGAIRQWNDDDVEEWDTMGQPTVNRSARVLERCGLLRIVHCQRVHSKRVDNGMQFFTERLTCHLLERKSDDE